MPEYKLTYFNYRGRAEYARILFAVKGVQYEDIRIEVADWPKIKPSKYTCSAHAWEVFVVDRGFPLI